MTVWVDNNIPRSLRMLRKPRTGEPQTEVRGDPHGSQTGTEKKYTFFEMLDLGAQKADLDPWTYFKYIPIEFVHSFANIILKI